MAVAVEAIYEWMSNLWDTASMQMGSELKIVLENEMSPKTTLKILNKFWR